MKTHEVQQNSSLGHGIKSAIIGGAVGYAAKYALPLTSQEMDSDYKRVVHLIKKNAVKAKQDFFAEIKDLPTRSLAHDTYINSAKKFAKHNICAYDTALKKIRPKKFAKHNICAYDTALKKIRPAAPFVIAGAVTGLVSSFVYNVFRTDV